MKADILRYIKILFLLLSLASCEEELNLTPPDAVANDNFWETPEDFKLGANHFYGTLPNHGGSDHDSDIQYANGFNAISSGTNILSDNDAFWNDRYAMLRQINSLLQKSEEYENSEAIATSVAEAKFFRAYEYFRLVQRYGDVPYYEKPLDVQSEGLTDPRTSREIVITNVLADLEEAAPDLPLESETSGSDQGRVTQGAALALKAKVALFEATWVKYHGTAGNANTLLNQAIDAAEKVINSTEYELYMDSENPTLSYKRSYGIMGNDSKEQILARRYHPDVSGMPFNWVNNVCCGGLSDGTKKLADMYLAEDGLPIEFSDLFQGYNTMTSEYENRDLRMTNTLHVPGTVQIFRDNQQGDIVYPRVAADEETGYRANKLVVSYTEGYNPGQAYDFKHVLKYSEVLLTLAEALYERDGEISDEDLDRTINNLRDRAGITHLSNAFVTENGLDMLEEIRRERTVELAWDGKRLNDLKRWEQAVEELNKPIKGVNIGSGAWNEIYPEVSEQFAVDEDGFKIVQPLDTREFDERNYLFPIPTQQIQLNPNLEQNPGW